VDNILKIIIKRSWSSGIVFSKRTCNQTNLVILEVPNFCTYTLAPAVVPLLEAPLEGLFWYGSETCCHILLRFLHGCKPVTTEPHLEFQEEPKVAKSEIWRIWWLGDDWNLVLHQKGGVTGCTVIVQDLFLCGQLQHTNVSACCNSLHR
jgi:hypothetical protein